jgi:hypothetical protein
VPTAVPAISFARLPTPKTSGALRRIGEASRLTAEGGIARAATAEAGTRIPAVTDEAIPPSFPDAAAPSQLELEGSLARATMCLKRGSVRHMPLSVGRAASDGPHPT